jgi:hypothetical protein
MLMAALTKDYAKLDVRKWTGDPIKLPGIYSGVPIEDYHGGGICVEPSISSSGLRKLYSPLSWVKASPAHYWMQSPYNPDRANDEEESEALILGRAAHHLLFGEKKFKEVFAVRPLTINGVKCDRTTTMGKLWHKQQEKAGLTIIKLAQLKAIKGVARELAKEPLVIDPEGKRSGILNGYIEHSWFFRHRTGVWVKIRPDATPNDSLDFVDLKTAKSVMWPDLQRAIRDHGYFMQAGLTAMAVQAILKQPLNSFTLVFAESSEPHCIEIVTLKENEIKRGIDACEVALDKFARCWKEKHWPGPRGDRADAQFIELLESDQKRIDENLTLERSEDEKDRNNRSRV